MATKRRKGVTKTKSKKQTALQKEYAKQRKRITSYISRKKREGYEINFVVPAVPKRITKASISQLTKIKPAQILKGAVKKPLTPSYPRATDNVLSTIEAMVSKLDTSGMLPWQANIHARHISILKRVLEGAIIIQGREAVAERLEQNANEIIELVEKLMYGDSNEHAFQVDLTNFAELLKGAGLSSGEALEVQAEGDMYDI